MSRAASKKVFYSDIKTNWLACLIGSMEWEKVDNIIGPSPAEMSSHAATAIDEHKMIIFGGTKDNVFYNNAFVLDTRKPTLSHTTRHLY